MKITTTILILSTLLLVGCNEAKDTTPLPKTPEPVTVQAEAENDVVPVS